jgi:SPP1 gp7 family putative phage head morphogenesis protein
MMRSSKKPSKFVGDDDEAEAWANYFEQQHPRPRKTRTKPVENSLDQVAPDINFAPSPLGKVFDALKDLATSGLVGKQRVLSGRRRKPPKPKSETETTTNERYKFASTQFDITDPVIVADIARLQSMIDPADVLKIPNDHHITVLYGLEQLDPARIQPLLDETGRVYAKLGPLSLFQNEDADVLKFDVDSQQLHALYRRLRILPHTLMYEKYQPHITVAYLRPGTGSKYITLPQNITGSELTLTHLQYKNRDGDGTVLNTTTLHPSTECGCHGDSLSQFSRFLFSTNKAPSQKALAEAVYELMDDVTKKEATEIARTVLEGYEGDASVEKVAKELKKRLGFDDARANAVAVTETTRVRAADSITQAASSGLKSVKFRAHAGACAICQLMNGKEFSIAEAQHKLPVHPHCECGWSNPVTGNELVGNVFCATGKGGGVDPTCPVGTARKYKEGDILSYLGQRVVYQRTLPSGRLVVKQGKFTMYLHPEELELGKPETASEQQSTQSKSPHTPSVAHQKPPAVITISPQPTTAPTKPQKDTGAKSKPSTGEKYSGKVTAEGTINPKSAQLIFGQPVTHDELALLTGAKGNVTVEVHKPKYANEKTDRRIKVSVKGEGYEIHYTFKKDDDGKMVADLDHIEVSKQAKGLGAKIFSRSIAALTDKGFHRIDMECAGSKHEDYVGYKVWPKFGVEGSIAGSTALYNLVEETGNKKFASAKTILELYAMPGGREAWAEHGAGFYGSFDLSRGSKSRQIFDKYLEKKNAK